MSIEFRLRVYTKFAEAANKAGINWMVLHGIEGFPEGIGRDLDVSCKTPDDDNRLLKTFVEVLQNTKGIRSIIMPSPIWGDRVLGIGDNFEVAELHIIDDLRAFNISFGPSWEEEINYIGPFPVNPFMVFAKSHIIPSFKGKIFNGNDQDHVASLNLPGWLVKYFKTIEKGRRSETLDKIKLSLRYFFCHPFKSLINLYFWIEKRKKKWLMLTVPVIRFQSSELVDSLNEVYPKKLKKIFSEMLCCDQWSAYRISMARARQNLIYVTHKRRDIKADFSINSSSLSSQQLGEMLVDYFSEFSVSRYKAYYESKGVS